MSILQYKVSATVIDSIVFVFALFVFMLVLLSLSCYRFSVNKDLYITRYKRMHIRLFYTKYVPWLERSLLIIAAYPQTTTEHYTLIILQAN